MNSVQMNSEITVLDVKYLVGDIVKSLTLLNGQQFVDFMLSLKLNIPRTLRMDVLRELLSERVELTIVDRDKLADELNYRLKWFAEFSDTQYVNLLSFYEDEALNSKYLEQLWLHLFSYLVTSGVSEQNIIDLYQLSMRQKEANKVEIKAFNDSLNTLFFDKNDDIDGLSQDKARFVLYKSSTLVELREIGLKFGVDVPRRLKKAELLESIYNELKERNQFNQGLKEELAKKTVIAIQRFAVENQIKVSTELKKEEIIEYILEHALQTKETYFKPKSNIYDFEIVEHKTNEEIPKSLEVNEQEVASLKDLPKKEKIEKVKSSKKSKVVETTEEKPTLEVQSKADEINIEEQETVVIDADAQLEEHIETVEQEVKESSYPYFATTINALKYTGSTASFVKKYSKLEFNTSDSKHSKLKAPLEIRFIYGILKFVFLIVIQILLLVAVSTAILAAVLVVYGIVLHFVNLDFLNVVNDFINGFEFLGKGLFNHISDILSSLGL